MTELVLSVGLLFLLWLCVWAGAFRILIPHKIHYLQGFLPFSLYFLIATLIGGLLFRPEVSVLLASPRVPILPFALLMAVMVVTVCAYRYTKKYVPRPAEAEFVLNGPNPSFLALDYRYIVSKSCEIFFQQLFIAALIVLLLRLNLAIWHVMILFAILFGSVHLPLLWTGTKFWGWYFTLFAVGSALIFPPIISSVPYGFVYTYMIHWMFYTLSGVFFWIWYGKNHQRLQT